MKILFALLLAALAAGPQFEVASVRPTSPTGEHALSLSLRFDTSQVRIAALPLRDIVALAYRVQPAQVLGPDWMRSTPIDIVARLPEGATAQQIPDMLQALLAERFGLVVHREKRETAAYALVVGKPPLQLERHGPPSASAPATGELEWALSARPSGVATDLGGGASYSFAEGRFEGRKLTVQALAAELSRFSPRPIVDATGLSGEFDMSFTISHEAYMQLLVRAAYNSGMTIPPQVQQQMESAGFDNLPDAVEQMGLKLDSRRMPLDVVVVDAVQRTATDN
jgi:uncharacterized protein (TIGR03435 family)